MAERRENSVLFSLRELRQIEDDRVKQEDNDKQAAEEAVRQAKIAEERARQAAIEQQRRDAEAAENRRLEAEQLRLREEQLRLDEVERQRRADNDSRLEQERVRLEIEAKTQLAARRKPWALIIAASVLFVLVGGLGIYLKMTSDEKAANEAQAKIEKEQYEKAIADMKAQMEKAQGEFQAATKRSAELLAMIEKEKDENKLKELKAERDRQEAIMRAKGEEMERLRKEDIRQRTQAVDVKCKNPNSPLCGVK
jgi:membrane protein involved in colicin uptake